MIESWLRAAERIERLAAVSGARTIGLISIGGGAGVSTLSQLLCRVLSGGKTKALLVSLTSPLREAAADESAAGGFVWDWTTAREDGCAAIAARPTAGNRFRYNDGSLLQEAWNNELGTYSRLIIDLPPVLHLRNDLLSPLAAAASCDAVFLVCMLGRTTRSQLGEAVGLLRASRVPLAGIVVNERDDPGAVKEISAHWTTATEEDPPERTKVRRFLQAAWRRRYLVLVPILVMLPLSVVAAKLLPVPYVATSLLLLQEPGIEGPSGIAFAVSERIEERIPGLEALLKSSRVLSPALANLRKAGLATPEQKGSIRDLQDRLSMKLLGLDVLQINLKGDTQHGLGDQLKEVVTRFLETLTSDQGTLTAGELLVQDRRAAWQRAEQAYAEAQTKLSATTPERTGPNDLGEKNRQSQLLQLQAEVQSAERQYAALAERYDHDSAAHPQMLLNAPERIRIVDPPINPEIPETSRVRYVLFGVAASVALGIALAWAVERTDSSLRDLREFAAAGGAPVVARLPRFTALDVASRKRGSARSWRLSLSALFILILLSLPIWLHIAFPETTAAILRLWDFK